MHVTRWVFFYFHCVFTCLINVTEPARSLEYFLSVHQWGKLNPSCLFLHQCTKNTLTRTTKTIFFKRIVWGSWRWEAQDECIIKVNYILLINKIIKMPSHQQASNSNHHHNSHRSKRRRRDQSEVSCCLKYVIFGFNVIFWVSHFNLVSCFV